jgi:hypothetical protein
MRFLSLQLCDCYRNSSTSLENVNTLRCCKMIASIKFIEPWFKLCRSLVLAQAT